MPGTRICSLQTTRLEAAEEGLVREPKAYILGPVEYPNGTYEASYDGQAVREDSIAGMKANWKSWLVGSLRYSSLLAVYSAMLCAVLSLLLKDDSYFDSVLVAFGFAYIVGAVYTLHYMGKSADSALSYPEHTWQCEVTDEGWGFRSEEGIYTFIPWAAMKLESEKHRTWYISYEKKGVWVFREPLRKAGLEQGFKARIGMGKEA